MSLFFNHKKWVFLLGLFFVHVPLQATDREFNTVTVANTTTETTVYSFTVPANYLGVSRGMKIHMWGTYQQNSGNNRTLTIRLKLGGTTLLTVNSTNIVDANATAGSYALDAVLFNAYAANVQSGSMTFIWNRGGGTPASLMLVDETNAGAIDTTADQVFSITVQHSNTNANISFVKLGAAALLL